MPPKNWMIAAPGAEALASALAEDRERQQQAQARAGVGLEQEQDRLAVSGASVVPERREDAVVDRVVEEQHLGRLDEDRGQRQQVVVDQEVDAVAGAARLNAATIGPMRRRSRRSPGSCPEMPAEKLLTSISKPGRILPSQSASIFFIDQPPSGPMIIAPRNIGTVARRRSTPIVRDRADHAAADVVVTHPAAGVADQHRQQVGDHRADDAAAVAGAPAADLGDPAVGRPQAERSRAAEGDPAVSMNRAVIRPQAMNAPMLGITMLDRKVPNFWTWTRTPRAGRCGGGRGHLVSLSCPGT